jgi:ATP-binding cassette subfamily F protein uup
MKDFLFAPEQARTPVRVLSGGERGRLMLARALARPSNLLVLDEPTNDLDLETLDLLQEMLADYPGTVLLVSHDRDFLDRVATSVIASEGDGHWIEYAGGYSDMITQRAGAPATGAHTSGAKPATKQKSRKPAASLPHRAQQPKLSFREKHALDTLPARMAALAADIAKHEATLADPTLYTTDPSGYEASAKAFRHAQAALTTAEEEWLSLEIKRESIDGG